MDERKRENARELDERSGERERCSVTLGDSVAALQQFTRAL